MSLTEKMNLSDKKSLKSKVEQILKDRESNTEAFSKEDFEALKSYYGELTELEVEGKTFLFHPPDDFILNEAAKMTTEDYGQDFAGSADVILFNCALNGLEVLRQDTLLRQSLRKHLKQIQASKTVLVKKR